MDETANETIAESLALALVETWSRRELERYALATLRDTYCDSFPAFVHDWYALYGELPIGRM